MPSDIHEQKIQAVIAAGRTHGLHHLPQRRLKQNGHKIPDAVLVVDKEHDGDEGRYLAVEVGGLSQERLDVFAHTMMLWVPKDGDLVGLWNKGQAVPCETLNEALQAAAAVLRNAEWTPGKKLQEQLVSITERQVFDEALAEWSTALDHLDEISVSCAVYDELRDGDWRLLIERLSRPYQKQAPRLLTMHGGAPLLLEYLRYLHDNLMDEADAARDHVLNAIAQIEEAYPELAPKEIPMEDLQAAVHTLDGMFTRHEAEHPRPAMLAKWDAC
jgi:hypothetical protein